MNHYSFQKIRPIPDGLFFDLDKQKYVIQNEASGLSDFELTKLRKTCQQYNSEWNAYQHGLNEAKKSFLI